jgi:hypothetical protein
MHSVLKSFTACLPLKDCIVQTTNFCRRAGVQITRLPAYGRIILRCMHTRATIWELLGCSGRFSNCMGEHVAACCSGNFSNCIQVLGKHLQWHTVGLIGQKALNKVVCHTDATMTLLDATRRYQTLPDATRRYQTIPDATRSY